MSYAMILSVVLGFPLAMILSRKRRARGSTDPFIINYIWAAGILFLVLGLAAIFLIPRPQAAFEIGRDVFLPTVLRV